MIENKHTIKELLKLMEDAGESPHFIIGWLSAMIDGAAEGYPVKGFTIQNEIDYGVKFYKDKSLVAGRQIITQHEEIYA